MNEGDIKDRFIEIATPILRGFVLFRHEDRSTFGIPDISATGYNKSSWWEFKHAIARHPGGEPDFKSRGNQELSMLRLASAGYARYVIYEERGDIKRVLIVHPKKLSEWMTMYDSFTTGFNHRWVADQIRRVHV